MKHDEAKRVIQESLENPYDSINFSKLIANILTTPFKVINNTVGEAYVREAFRDSISSYTVIWTYEDPANKRIAILEVRLKNTASLQNARTMQRNFVADFLKWGNAYGRQDGALVAFVSPNPDDWRFSLVKMEYSPEIRDGKIKINEELTPAKRWSFLVWKHEKSHTAQSRFLPLVMEESHSTTLAEIENAFDVEKVTDEFFEQYKECFFRFKDEIDRIVSTDDTVRVHFESIWLDTANFAKKTLWQIAFLYFLQKKWWFGVASDNDWGKWPKDFLRKLFERKEKYGSNFFNDILEPLFYEALATDRWESAIYTRLNNTRIPFLNGGLFEPMKWYSWETTNLVINDEIFSNTHKTKNGDIGDGIFDVFDRYNFTVSEDEPLEKEVAVDPEMLGKIFENLLEVRDRKSKWAFYTPRPIVHYMCQESLIEYLASIDPSIPREELELFIRESESILENDKTTKRKIEEALQKGRPYKWDYEYNIKLTNIRKHAKKLDDALANVRIADPAVWSGAFPLGMINEIVRARQILAVHTWSNLTVYRLKLHAIQESIYGVDLDPGAVEICQLRLWLSLIVDEDQPHPLPNLNYRIVQGNSLIEEYEWIKLYDTKLLSAGKWKVEQMSMDSLMASESNKLYELLQHNLKKFIETSERTKKQSLKKEIDDLKYWLIEATLREQNKEERIVEIRRLREANITPFFLWKLEFSEVFQEKWGFDIVIGNPPYVQLQKFARTQIQKDLENAGYSTFAKTWDLYCLFYERGLEMTRKETGVLCYITSNKWMRAWYGEKLRKYFSSHNPLKLIDLWSDVFSTATVDSNILLIQNKPNCGKTFASTIKNSSNSLYPLFKDGSFVKFESSDWWFIWSLNENHLITKITSTWKPLKEWDLRIYFWVKTWLNSVFIIDKTLYNSLIEQDIRNAEIIKPILRWRDISRYSYNWAEKYIIMTGYDINIQENYPSIYSYMNQYKDALEKRDDQGKYWWSLRSCAYYSEFEKEKFSWQEISTENTFVKVESWMVILWANCFMTWYSDYLLWVLNSKIIRWFLERTSSGIWNEWLRYKNQYLELIPVPESSTNKEIAWRIEILAKQITESKLTSSFSTKNLENQIDELVYKLYNLTPEEIDIIEGGK
jgi:hypothetical protein